MGVRTAIEGVAKLKPAGDLAHKASRCSGVQKPAGLEAFIIARNRTLIE
jgi:hypothetical protein